MSAKVPVADMVWAAPIAQCLIALDMWPKLTPKQRTLVAACRVEVNPDATYPDRYKVQLDGCHATGRTLASLQAKGVLDGRGQLTEIGVYTALWGD